MPFNSRYKMFFTGDCKTSFLVTFAPHPNPPSRRGEGRAGVMFSENLLQGVGILDRPLFLLKYRLLSFTRCP